MKRLGLIVLLLMLLAFPSNARADVAPPLYPPGVNPQPGVENTQVRMVAETVVIEVRKDIAPRSLGNAHVTADFTMRNLGSADETMAARFPISVNNGRWEYPEIQNLQIQVNEQQVLFRRVSYPDVSYAKRQAKGGVETPELFPWAEFDLTFPVEQDVSIRVAYDLEGTGYYPATAFYYILATGAGWKDTIGSADIILRLPYEANLQNIIDQGTGWATTTSGGVYEGNEVRWHLEDFEPGWEQNMEFALIAPSAWETVLAAQKSVEKHPNDGEAWGMLAKAYKLAFLAVKGYREDDGGMELYKLSLEAYEKCLSIKPNDAQWRAGLADLLAHRAMWEAWDGIVTPEALRALNEIRTALEMAPNDPVVQEVAYGMRSLLYGGIVQNGDQYEFPWLTQTPVTLPSATLEVVPVHEPTATLPAPTAMEAPEIAAVSTRAEAPAAPAPQRASPLCGSAAFLPLIALVWLFWKRR